MSINNIKTPGVAPTNSSQSVATAEQVAGLQRVASVIPTAQAKVDTIPSPSVAATIASFAKQQVA